MIDLEAPGSLNLLADNIRKDIDAFCIQKYDDGHRSHLGASVIGHPCSRNLWYNFRWVSHKTHSGRQYRLFQRGHLEEARVHDYLTGIGCNVQIFAQGTEHIEDKGKRQIRIYGCEGHFAGSVDGIIKLPERYLIQQDVLFLGEYKTQGTQKFPKLQKEGVQIAKHQHFCQQSIYGLKLGLQYAIYISVNKNDDDLHIEVIKLDWELGKFLEQKAYDIIFSNEPPNRISASPSYFDCKWCDLSATCWNNKPADKNCRSCKYCHAVKDAQWECKWYDQIVPKEFIKIGCNNWDSII